jgi:hypothetical protein
MRGSTSRERRGRDKRYAELTVGYTAQFVRWIETREGWRHEIVSGRYLGRQNGCFVILVDGHEHHLVDGDWSAYHE